MYKNTVFKTIGSESTMSLVDSLSTMEQISAETIRLGHLGTTRVVFQDAEMLSQWRQRVAAGESLRLQQR